MKGELHQDEVKHHFSLLEILRSVPRGRSAQSR